MATLNATNLKHASSSSNNIVLAANGSVNIPTLTTNSSFSLVRQHKIISKTTKSSTTLQTQAAIPDFSLTITPTASDSIMVVEANMFLSSMQHVTIIRLYNGTNFLISPALTNAYHHGSGSIYTAGQVMAQQSFTAFETAGNTNARTYNVYWACTSGTSWINRYANSDTYNSVSTLRVTEFAP